MCYAAGAWWSAIVAVDAPENAGNVPVTQSSAFAALEVIHHQYAVAISGAMQTVNIEAVLAEAHLLPLPTYMRAHATRAAVRMVHSPLARRSPGKRQHDVRQQPALIDLLGQALTLTMESNGKKTEAPRAFTFSRHVLEPVRYVNPSARRPDRIERPRWVAASPAEILEDLRGEPLQIVLPAKSRASLTPEEMVAYNRQQRCRALWAFICDGSIRTSSVGAVDLWEGGKKKDQLPCRYAEVGMAAMTPELLAITSAAEYANTLAVVPADIAILTDSRSSLEALMSRDPSPQLIDARAKLRTLASRTNLTLAFVYAHCGWEPHEAVDKRAGEAAEKAPPSGTRLTPLSLEDEKTKCVSEIEKAGEQELREQQCNLRQQITAGLSSPFLPWAKSRRAQMLLSQARTGGIGAVGGWRNERDEPCPLCNEANALGRQGKTTAHLFNCKKAATWLDELGLRRELKFLRTEPDKCVELIERWITAAKEAADMRG
jgi:hypothetical protein